MFSGRFQRIVVIAVALAVVSGTVLAALVSTLP